MILVIRAWTGTHALLSGAGGLAWFSGSPRSSGPPRSEARPEGALGGDLVEWRDGDLELPMSYGYRDSNYPAATSRRPTRCTTQARDDGVLTDVGQERGSTSRGRAAGSWSPSSTTTASRNLTERARPTARRRCPLSNCGDCAWLRVSTVGAGLETRSRSGRRNSGPRRRPAAPGRHPGRQHQPRERRSAGGPLGLGTATRADGAIEVWSDGAVSVVQDVGTRRKVQIVRR